MAFANRVPHTPETNELGRLKEQILTAGDRLLDLAESNPTQVGLRLPDSERILRLSDQINSQYAPDPKGSLPAREAIAEYYGQLGARVSPDRILLTSGTSEGYAFLLKLLLEPGESIAIPSPSYPLLGWLGRWEAIQTSPYPLRRESSRWVIDWSGAKETLASCRAALIVHPNNPTGHYTSAEDLNRLIELTRSGQSHLVSDEVFYDYSFEESKPPSLTTRGESLSFTLSGLSKVLALPQMKVSWIVVNGPDAEATEAMDRLELLADSFLSVNTPAQNALPHWMRQRHAVQRIIRNRINENRDLIKKFIKESGSLFEYLESEGGWQAVLRWNFPLADEEFTLSLLKKESVFMHPGYFYDFEGDSFAVISLIIDPTILEEGLTRTLRHARHL